MDYRVTTIEEAWNFLINEVYQNNNGEFRIHNNKKGIRLYLRFYNRKYTGYKYNYCTFNSKESSKKYPQNIIYHTELYCISTHFYEDSIVSPTLIDCVNAHITEMCGNVKNECYTEIYGTAFEGSVQEFVNQYIEYYGQDRIDRKQVSQPFFYQKQDIG